MSTKCNNTSSCGCPSTIINNEPCIQPSYPSRKQAQCSRKYPNILRYHPMNNPIVLASIDTMAFDNPCQNINAADCMMTAQNKCLGNPVPRPCCCYPTKRDCEREQFRQEFEMGYHRKIKTCERCQDIKILRQLPHCCACTCEYYQSSIKKDRENMRRRKYCRCPVGRTDHGQMGDRKRYNSKYSKKKICKEQFTWQDFCDAAVKQEEVGLGKSSKPLPPPFKPNFSKGLISVYRADYRPPKCKGRRSYPADPTNSIEFRPPWNKSTRPYYTNNECCRHTSNTIGSAEAKLEELDKLLGNFQSQPKE